MINEKAPNKADSRWAKRHTEIPKHIRYALLWKWKKQGKTYHKKPGAAHGKFTEDAMGMGCSSPTTGTGGIDMPENPLFRGFLRRKKPVDVLNHVLAKRRRRNVAD